MRLSRFAPFALALLLFCLLAVGASAEPRHPRAHKDGQWTRDTVHTGPNGKQSTTHVEGAKTGNSYTKTTTHTGPNGGVTTTQGQGTWDPKTKTWTRDRVVTHPNGSTSSTEVTRTVTPVTPEPPAAQ